MSGKKKENPFVDGIYNMELDIKDILKGLDNQSLEKLLENDKLSEYAANIAKRLHKSNISPTQLRRFYTYVKAIDRKNVGKQKKDAIVDEAKLKFLLPKLAGSAKRNEEGIQNLYGVFEKCLRGKNRVSDVGSLRLLVEFFEAILDYRETYRN